MQALRKALATGLRPSPASLALIRGSASQAGDQSVLPLKTGRPRLVILGTGWGGAALARDIDPKRFDLTVCRRMRRIGSMACSGGIASSWPDPGWSGSSRRSGGEVVCFALYAMRVGS